MKNSHALALLLGSASPALAQCLEVGVVPPSADVQFFGAALDVDGDLGVLAAPGYTVPVAAYLFDSTTGAILHEWPLTSAVSHLTAMSVDIEGAHVVVGNGRDDTLADDAGTVYVFDRATRALVHQLSSPFPAEWARFGSAVAISGGHLVVGASQDPKVAPFGGAVYVFDLATGAYLHELTAGPVAGGDLFGHEVVADGGRAMVAAPYSDEHGDDAGEAHVFDVATGALLSTLTPSAPTSSFGYSACAEGGRVALSGSSSQVFVFDLATGAQADHLVFPSKVPHAGTVAVALEGDRLLVGQFDERAVGKHSGRALEFDLSTGDRLTTLVDPTADPFVAHTDGLGWAVALDGGRGYISAPGRKGNVHADHGAVFFTRSCALLGASYCGPAVRNSLDLPGRIEAHGSDVVLDEDVLLRAVDLPPYEWGLFLTSATQDLVKYPGGSHGYLCLGGPIGRYAAFTSHSANLGELYLVVDLKALPLTPPHAVQPGETWNFQAWYRDQNPGHTSNFTDARAITFQ